MKLTYTQSGDYLLPDLTLTNEPVSTYGKYGRMRKRYLQEHRKTLYNELLLSGKLVAHLNDVDAQANDYLARAVPEMAKLQGVTETLKAEDQMAWVGVMNMIHAQIEEIILTEIVHN